MRGYFLKLCLFALSFFVSPSLIASTDSIKDELNEFLQTYHNSPEIILDWSSIAYAIENDYDVIAEFLINKGENFEKNYPVKFKSKDLKENIYWKHPLLTAIAKGKVLLVALMGKKVSMYHLKEYWAIGNDHIKHRKALQIGITDCPNSYEMVQTLLEAGAYVNDLDDFQPDPDKEPLRFYPLTFAILEKRLDIAALLIEYGASPDSVSLLESIRIDFLEGTEFLLNHGAKVNKTILWDVIKQNKFNALVLLLNANKNNVEFDMITYANSKGFYEIADILMNAYTK